MTAPELVFSGVQPTGNLHLGNYLGAIVNFVKMQETHNCIYCVVDLHALAQPFEVWGGPNELARNTREVTAAVVLASRSETERGEWERFRGRFGIETCGSVAYKLARVAAGSADATFTLSPKSEWDVCSSACVIECAGGRVTDIAGHPLRYNQPSPTVAGVVATNGALHDELLDLLRG